MMGAQIIVAVVTAYLFMGFVFALFFVTVGAGRVDSAARGAPWGFRVLIFPGAAALWPLLMHRLISVRAEGKEHG